MYQKLKKEDGSAVTHHMARTREIPRKIAHDKATGREPWDGELKGKPIDTNLDAFDYQLLEKTLKMCLSASKISNFVNSISKYARCRIGTHIIESEAWKTKTYMKVPLLRNSRAREHCGQVEYYISFVIQGETYYYAKIQFFAQARIVDQMPILGNESFRAFVSIQRIERRVFCLPLEKGTQCYVIEMPEF